MRCLDCLNPVMTISYYELVDSVPRSTKMFYFCTVCKTGSVSATSLPKYTFLEECNNTLDGAEFELEKIIRRVEKNL